jgi:chromosome segregation ATPase
MVEDLTALRSRIDHQSQGALAEIQRQQQDMHCQLAQRLIRLEARQTERYTTELPTTIAEQLKEQELRVKGSLNALAADSKNALTTIEHLAEHVHEGQGALNEIRSRFEALISRTASFETSTSHTLAQLRSEIDVLRQPERIASFIDGKVSEVQVLLTAKIEELERRMSIEQEELAHWANGLRESFGSELSALHTRLLERYSDIEHRHGSMERNQKMVEGMLKNIEFRLEESCQNQDHNLDSQTLLNQLHSIVNRLDESDSRESRAMEHLTRCIADSQAQIAQAFDELRSTKTSMERLTATDATPITSALQLEIDRRIQDCQINLSGQLNSSRSLIDTQLTEFKATAINLAQELDSVKQACEASGRELRTSRAFEELVETKIRNSQGILFERLERLETEHATCPPKDAKEVLDTLRKQVEEVQHKLRDYNLHAHVTSLAEIRDSLTCGLSTIRQELAGTTTDAHNRYTSQRQWLEQTLRDALAEINAVKNQMMNHVTNQEPAFQWKEIEDRLKSTVDQLRSRIDEQAARVEKSATEIAELKLHFDAMSSESAEAARTAKSARELPQFIATSANRESSAGRNEMSIQNRSLTGGPPEQLQELQERMSAEIERVRAELKQRSSRWKVRKSGT